MERDPSLYGRRYRNGNRDMGRTILRNHQLHRLGHIQDVCRHLFASSLVCLCRLGRMESSKKVLHTNHDQPFWLLDTVSIGLWISQSLNLDVLGLLNLVGGSVSDEDGLTTPFDNDLLLWIYISTKISLISRRIGVVIANIRSCPQE